MTATTLTLTEFLLARIAEDEQAWSSGLWEHGDNDRARMLAECLAKRRIVERYDYYGKPYALEDALLALAAVYADHPDYRDEWRP